MDYFLSGAGEKPASKKIGLISDFVLTNSCDPRHIFRKMDGVRHLAPFYQAPSRNLEDRIWVEHSAIRLWLQLFDECKRRNQQVTVRVHHREDIRAYDFLLQKYAGILSVEGNDIPFESWLEGVSLVAGFNSTTFFETVAAGKPGINLEGLLGPRLAEHTEGFTQNHYPIMDFIPSPGSMEELFTLIGRFREAAWDPKSAYGAEARDVVRDVCDYPRESSTLDRIVETVLGDIASGPARRAGNPLTERLGIAKALASEFVTFRVRRDPVGNSWFPLEARAAARFYAPFVERYLASADRFPARTARRPQMSGAGV